MVAQHLCQENKFDLMLGLQALFKVTSAPGFLTKSVKNFKLAWDHRLRTFGNIKKVNILTGLVYTPSGSYGVCCNRDSQRRVYNISCVSIHDHRTVAEILVFSRDTGFPPNHCRVVYVEATPIN